MKPLSKNELALDKLMNELTESSKLKKLLQADSRFALAYEKKSENETMAGNSS